MEQLLAYETELMLGGITLLFFVIQMGFWLVAYARPVRVSRKGIPGPEPTEAEALSVSVVVYAKNESENLELLLPSLLTQEYPSYEVIVVNDGSTDESDEVLKRYELGYPHLYHTYIPEDAKYLSRKKLALTVGIKAAKHDVLLFTEANCRPISDQWIREMSRAYGTQQTEVVLGFCAYGHYPGFLHKLIAYDNLLTGLQGLSSALAKQPYTGSGRNLSYRKALFFRHKGYYKSLNLHAGDDDLFVNEVATSQNTRVQYTPGSITEMSRIEQFKVWKEMKVSAAATRRYYRGKQLTYYRVEAVSSMLFQAAVIASVAAGAMGFYPALAGVLPYILLYGVKGSVLRRSARMLQQEPLTLWLPLLDIVRPAFDLYIRIYRMFRGKNDFTFRILA